MTETKIKQEVREFYDQVGWKEVAEGVYQNARYEDLRPVSRDYIHNCHMRIMRHIAERGRFLLDVGSGPVQYPEYITYSAGYEKRVCLDISGVALVEARKRLGAHGLYVVADAANLPFAAATFDGLVSLHTLHHLPPEDHARGYFEFARVLKPGRSAAVVNGWNGENLSSRLVQLMRSIRQLMRRLRAQPQKKKGKKAAQQTAVGTFVQKFNPAWLKEHLGGKLQYEIYVWRSVSVNFLRHFIRPRLGGRFWLRLLYALEERYPRYFGEHGQYPLIVITKETNDEP